MTKKQAIEILNRTLSKYDFDDQPRLCLVADLADGLDRAGAFPSEAQVNAIDDAIATMQNHKTEYYQGSLPWREWALRLASACCAAGLVKP